MFKKLLFVVLAIVCLFSVNVVNADEIIITNAGTKKYEAIKKAIFNERTASNLVDHLRSQGFSNADIALATGYFLHEVQEGKKDSFPVYTLDGIYAETDKAMIETILEHLVCFQGMKSTVDIYEAIDVMKDVPKPENREAFLKSREEIRRIFQEYKDVYLENAFHMDWINHSVLSMGEDFKETFGVNPVTFSDEAME